MHCWQRNIRPQASVVSFKTKAAMRKVWRLFCVCVERKHGLPCSNVQLLEVYYRRVAAMGMVYLS